MSEVANDNRGCEFRHTSMIPERFHVRLMRPKPGESAPIAKWRQGDFALAYARPAVDDMGRLRSAVRILAAQPHPEAIAIHEMEQARDRSPSQQPTQP